MSYEQTVPSRSESDKGLTLASSLGDSVPESDRICQNNGPVHAVPGIARHASRADQSFSRSGGECLIPKVILDESPTTEAKIGPRLMPRVPRGALSLQQRDALPPAEQLARPETKMLLTAYARSLTKNRDQAEDLSAQTILKAWTALQRGQYKPAPGLPFRAYIMTIMRYQFLTDMRRKRFTADVTDFDFMASRHLICEPMQEKGDLASGALMKAMEQLPAIHQEVLWAMGRELTYEEAADELGLPLGTLKSRVSRARSALSNLMDPGP